ncbi:hypothetical protein NMY22_g10131 [Coprinellus aureogranulatus]|nr:hypothetical protein NMY22_g10131 [Coprinellus aureogranulatus]
MAAPNIALAQAIQGAPRATIVLVPHNQSRAVLTAVGPNGRGKASSVDEQTSLVVFTTHVQDWDSISMVARVSIVGKRRRLSLVSNYLPYASITAEATDGALLVMIFLSGLVVVVLAFGLMAQVALAIENWVKESLPLTISFAMRLIRLGKLLLQSANYNARSLFQSALQLIIAGLGAMLGKGQLKLKRG